MHELSSDEIDCLKRIAEQGTHIPNPCPPQILESLKKLGLIDCGSARFLPLEYRQSGYQLPTSGAQTLQRIHLK